MMHSEDVECFKPSRSKLPRLQGLGIPNHPAMIRMQVVLKPEAKKALAEEILRSKSRGDRKKIQALVEQEGTIL